jgi:hypothetical protein
MKKIFLSLIAIVALSTIATAQEETRGERSVTKIDKSTVKPATLPTKTYPAATNEATPEVKKKEVEPLKRNVRSTPKAIRSEKPVEKTELKQN